MFLIANWLPTFISVVTVSVIIRWLIHFYNRVSRLPPGPWGIPIFGYLPWLTDRIFLDFIKIGKKYGGMFSITLGTETFIVLNDWSSIKATLVENPTVFSGRRMDIIKYTYCRDKGIAFSEGKAWRLQRNLAVQGMKFVGMNKKTVENHLTHMIDNLINKLSKFEAKEIDFETVISEDISYFNWQLISKIEVDNPESFRYHAKKSMEVNGANNLVVLMPWLRFLPPDGFGYWRYRRSVRQLRQQMLRLINQHSLDLPPDDSIITHHLHQFHNKQNQTPPYQMDYLLGTILDLFLGSYETILSVTLAGMYYLCQYPETQEKAQRELDDVVGRQRLASLDDFANLPYLEAVISEIQRMCSVGPLSIPHKVVKNIEINGYEFPKDVVCLQNIYAVHNDPQLWDEPEEFKPERFLNSENKIQLPPFYMPFSVGPRICPGQAFAEMELRLLFSSLLQKFTFSFPKNKPTPTYKHVVGITIKPAPFPLVVTIRD